MKITFQPKVIIGSIFGIIATVIGLIAVFFPSLFNMELEDYGKPINLTIHKKAEFKKLFTDLLEKSKNNDDKIFNLNLTICHPDEFDYQGDWTDNFIITSDKNTTINMEGFFDAYGEDNLEADSYFITVELENYTSLQYLPPHSNPICKKTPADPYAGEKDSIILDGYFLLTQFYSPHAYEEVIVLQHIPQSQLKLKDY